MYKKAIVIFILVIFSFGCQTVPQHVDTFFQGTKQISLLDNKNKELIIGSISFVTKGNSTHYQIHLDEKLFKDHFLSMKEMKCLEGPELWCHLAYPYENPRSIKAIDFSWLAHDLLFMYKKKSAFGANFYNGIYYDFKLVSNKLIGKAMAVDLNLLAAPPEDVTKPQITFEDIDEIDLANRWLPVIEVK